LLGQETLKVAVMVLETNLREAIMGLREVEMVMQQVLDPKKKKMFK